MRIGIKLLLFLAHIFVMGSSHAQTVDQRKEIEKVSIFFKASFPKSPNRDTAMVFGFSFLVEVKKDSVGIGRLQSLTATDTIAYRIYPSYKFFETLNFTAFMNGRTEATFVFPVFVQQYDASYKETKFDEPVEKAIRLFPYHLYDNADDITKYIFFPVYTDSVITKY